MSNLLRRVANAAVFLSLVSHLVGIHCFPGARVLINHRGFSNRIKKSSSHGKEVLESSKRIISAKESQDQTATFPKETPSSSIYLSELEKVPSTLPGALHRFFLGKDRAPILALTAIIYFISNRISLHSSGYYVQSMDACILAGSIIFWWFQVLYSLF